MIEEFPFIIGRKKGGQSVACRGQIFSNVACRLVNETSSVEYISFFLLKVESRVSSCFWNV